MTPEQKEAFINNPDDSLHGHYQGYQYGCRCDKCKTANARYRKDRKGKYVNVLNDPESPIHGTPTGYQYGCRCDKCVKQNSIRVQEMNSRFKRELESDPSDKRHGTKTGYYYGCRCDRCCKAIGKTPKKKKIVKDVDHGTYTSYVHGKCRCDRCASAAKLYQASREVGISEKELFDIAISRFLYEYRIFKKLTNRKED